MSKPSDSFYYSSAEYSGYAFNPSKLADAFNAINERLEKLEAGQKVLDRLATPVGLTNEPKRESNQENECERNT